PPSRPSLFPYTTLFRSGVAKVVIKTRQYLAGVKPEDGALVLELMHFADELADAEKLHVPKTVEVGKREMTMAKSLIDSMSSKWKDRKSTRLNSSHVASS